MNSLTVFGSACGHQHIRATHNKTLEITSEPDISARATCVIGVKAQLAFTALADLRGRLVVTLSLQTANGQSYTRTIKGTANPDYDPDTRRLVMRRSDRGGPETFLVLVDQVAGQLDREFIHALSNAQTELDIHIAEIESPPPLIHIMIGNDQSQSIKQLYRTLNTSNGDLPRNLLVSLPHPHISDQRLWLETVQLLDSTNARWASRQLGAPELMMLAKAIYLPELLKVYPVSSRPLALQRQWKRLRSSGFPLAVELGTLLSDSLTSSSIVECFREYFHDYTVIYDTGQIDQGIHPVAMELSQWNATQCQAASRHAVIVLIPQEQKDIIPLSAVSLQHSLLKHGVTRRDAATICTDLGYSKLKYQYPGEVDSGN